MIAKPLQFYVATNMYHVIIHKSNVLNLYSYRDNNIKITVSFNHD